MKTSKARSGLNARVVVPNGQHQRYGNDNADEQCVTDSGNRQEHTIADSATAHKQTDSRSLMLDGSDVKKRDKKDWERLIRAYKFRNNY